MLQTLLLLTIASSFCATHCVDIRNTDTVYSPPSATLQKYTPSEETQQQYGLFPDQGIVLVSHTSETSDESIKGTIAVALEIDTEQVELNRVRGEFTITIDE